MLKPHLTQLFATSPTTPKTISPPSLWMYSLQPRDINHKSCRKWCMMCASDEKSVDHVLMLFYVERKLGLCLACQMFLLWVLYCYVLFKATVIPCQSLRKYIDICYSLFHCPVLCLTWCILFLVVTIQHFVGSQTLVYFILHSDCRAILMEYSGAVLGVLSATLYGRRSHLWKKVFFNKIS